VVILKSSYGKFPPNPSVSALIILIAGAVLGELLILLSSLEIPLISSRLGDTGVGGNIRLLSLSDGGNNEFSCLLMGDLAKEILSISSCLDPLLADLSSLG
jgi:hypothetical protein